VSGLLTGSGVTTITFTDSSATKLLGSAQITCS
jgi:hypothetical protein